jgi:hypothetical protein
MHAKHAPIHNCPQREIIKHITAIPPYIPTPILSLTLVIEAIHLGDLAGFVVSPDEGDAIWVSDF